MPLAITIWRAHVNLPSNCITGLLDDALMVVRTHGSSLNTDVRSSCIAYNEGPLYMDALVP